MEIFSEVFKDLVQEKGVSLNEIQRQTKIYTRQLSAYKVGAFPTIKSAIALANYFECTLDYLFGLSEKRYKKPKCSLSFNTDKFLEKYDEVLRENKTTNWKFSKNRYSDSRIRGWQAGQIPKMEILVTIAKELSCSLDWLLSE